MRRVAYALLTALLFAVLALATRPAQAGDYGYYDGGYQDGGYYDGGYYGGGDYYGGYRHHHRHRYTSDDTVVVYDVPPRHRYLRRLLQPAPPRLVHVELLLPQSRAPYAQRAVRARLAATTASITATITCGRTATTPIGRTIAAPIPAITAGPIATITITIAPGRLITATYGTYGYRPYRYNYLGYDTVAFLAPARCGREAAGRRARRLGVEPARRLLLSWNSRRLEQDRFGLNPVAPRHGRARPGHLAYRGTASLSGTRGTSPRVTEKNMRQKNWKPLWWNRFSPKRSCSNPAARAIPGAGRFAFHKPIAARNWPGSGTLRRTHD